MQSFIPLEFSISSISPSQRRLIWTVEYRFATFVVLGFFLTRPWGVFVPNAVLQAELVTNYLAIVALIKFFMPHFLKRSVSSSLFKFSGDNPLTLMASFVNSGRKSALVHHTRRLEPCHYALTTCARLLCLEGGLAHFHAHTEFEAQGY